MRCGHPSRILVCTDDWQSRLKARLEKHRSRLRCSAGAESPGGKNSAERIVTNQHDVAYRPRLPWGLAGMLAVVVGVEGLLAFCVDDCFKNPSGACWQEAARASRREAVGAQVLAFGDSIVKFGFVPEVIEAETGLSA